MSPDIFKALADESRRFLLDKLRVQDGLTLNELVDELDMSRQAVSKHLAILERANLVTCVQKGRHKHHFLNPVPLQEIVERWLDPYRQSQVRALVDLKKQLEEQDDTGEH
jgi:DNA-binding transcriptional ArsR family regulator